MTQTKKTYLFPQLSKRNMESAHFSGSGTGDIVGILRELRRRHPGWTRATVDRDVGAVTLHFADETPKKRPISTSAWAGLKERIDRTVWQCRVDEIKRSFGLN